MDEARSESDSEEFRLFVFGTYDGEFLSPGIDPELPADPCGKSINELKRCFYGVCRKIDSEFEKHDLNDRYRQLEERFLIHN